jgi:P-type Cu+ transporter
MTELNMAPMAKDPVCGMDVNPEIASAQGLRSEHGGETYYFCGKGCKLDFEDDPQRFFAPDYVPSM